MKQIRKYKIHKSVELFNPIIYTVVDDKDSLVFRIDGQEAHCMDEGEYVFLNSDFSRAGSVEGYFNNDGFLTQCGYNANINNEHFDVEHRHSIIVDKFFVLGTQIEMHVLAWRFFWIYDGEKTIAKGSKSLLKFPAEYTIKTYSDNYSVSLYMGVVISALAYFSRKEDIHNQF